MSEQEEFEFRARLERERESAPAAPVAAPPGGAAFGVYPKQRAMPSRPETRERMRGFEEKASDVLGLRVPEEPEMSASQVGAAGGFGAAAGLGGPAALRGAGRMVGAIPTPVTRGAGALMSGLGTAMQRVPAARRAATGGAAVAGTELAGQLGEQVGVPRAATTAATLGLAPAAGRMAARGILGAPTQTREQYARAAESLGFKLSPAQVRAREPVPAKGAAFIRSAEDENQKLANQLVSSATGKEVNEISPTFVRDRLKDLGSKFDAVYKGKQFNIDQQAVQAIDSIARNEMQLPTNASVSAVKNTADTIIKNYQQMASRPGARPGTFAIEGDSLQRLRTDLLGAARSATNRQDAHQIYELVDIIDASVARNHPQVAAKLAELRPQYRNTVMLEDLIRAGGIQGGDVSLERLGNLTMGRKGGVRSERDLDKLAEMGRELKLRARWEKAGAGATPGESVLGQVLGTSADIAGRLTGLRSGTARGIQRYYAD